MYTNIPGSYKTKHIMTKNVILTSSFLTVKLKSSLKGLMPGVTKVFSNDNQLS